MSHFHNTVRWSILKTVPIDWYVLVAPFVTLATLMYICDPAIFAGLGGVKGIARHLFSNFFSLLFYTVALYFAVRSIGGLVFTWLNRHDVVNQLTTPEKKTTRATHQIFATSSTRASMLLFFQTFWLYGVYLGSIVAVAFFMAWLYAHVSLESTRAFSMVYTNWDLALGGSSYYASIISFFDALPFVGAWIADLYLGLPFVLGSLGLALACYSTRLFREYMFSFFMIALASMPFWYAFPAVSPSQYVREGVVGEVSLTHTELSQKTHEAVAGASKSYRENMALLEQMWQPHVGSVSYFAVSTNPSMHVAWGFLCVVYAFMLHRWVGIVVSLYQIANMIATVFLLQHYTVDIPAGIALMALTILMSRAVFEYEKWFFDVDSKWFRGITILQDECKRYAASVREDMLTMRSRYAQRFSRRERAGK